MDLSGRQVQSGELLDHRLVVGLTVGHRDRRERRTRLGHVLGAHEAEETLVRRRNDVADHRGRFAAQRRLLGSGDDRGHLRERRVQRVGTVPFHVRLDRLVAPGDRYAGHSEAAGEAGPHVGNLLVEVARHVAEAPEKRAIRAGRGETLARRELGPEEGVAVERSFVGAEPHVVGEGANRRAEHLRVHLLLGRELVERYAVKRLQSARPVGQPRLLGRGIDTGKAVARTRPSGLIAARQLLPPPVPLLRIQGAEPRVSGAGAALRLGRGRHEHEGGA